MQVRTFSRNPEVRQEYPYQCHPELAKNLGFKAPTPVCRASDNMGSPSKIVPSLALASLRSVRAALRMTLLKKAVAMNKPDSDKPAACCV